MDVQDGGSEGDLGSEPDSEPTEYDSEERLTSQELRQRDEGKRVGNGRERGGVSGMARGAEAAEAEEAARRAREAEAAEAAETARRAACAPRHTRGGTIF